MNDNRKLVFLMTLLMLISTLSLFTVSFAAEDLGSWQTKTSMPTARFYLGVAEVNGKIYAIGGHSDGNYSNIVEEYDPATDTWTTKANMQTARRVSVATANGKIYAIGGTNGSDLNTVEEYDPATDTWTTKTSMPTARRYLGIVEANGKIYAIGGEANGSSKDIVEEYDPATDTWTTKTSMPTARKYLGVGEVNGKIYAIGGMNTATLRTVEEYDPVSDTWTTKANMPTHRYDLVISETNNKIYAIGGRNSGYLKSVEEYDPATDTWTTKANMPTARSYLGAAEANGKIFAIGGYIGTQLNTVEEFTPPGFVLPVPDAPINLIANGGDSKVDLLWDSVAEADSYNVLRSTTSGGPYTTVAQEINGTSYTDTSIVNGTTYYYVVTAVNATGEGESSNEVSTQLKPNTPTNLKVTAGDSRIDLTWNSVTEADSYNVLRSTTSGGPYTTVAQQVYGTSYTDIGVINGTTYYYVVTAVNAGGESDNSNEASATPVSTSTGRALLKITMTNGNINEYDLSMNEVANFIDWYDSRANGTGKAYYTVDKNYNVGPFLSRKDYIIFDKVLKFEVMEYTE